MSALDEADSVFVAGVGVVLSFPSTIWQSLVRQSVRRGWTGGVLWAATLAVLTTVVADSPARGQLPQIPPPVGEAEDPEEEPEVRPAVVRPQSRRRVYTAPKVVPNANTQAKVDALIDEVLLPELTFNLQPNESKLLRTKQPVTRVSISDPQLVEVVQFSPTEFELIGQQIGHTTLTMWFGDPGGETEVLRYLVRVSSEEDLDQGDPLEYGDLEKRINELFPNSMIQLVPVLDKLIVMGQARDAKEATDILTILGGNTVNQTGELLGPGSLINLGPVATPPGTEDVQANNLINLLTVPGEDQIMLKVRVAELSRGAMRDVGWDFEIRDGDFTLSSLLAGDGPFSAVLDSTHVTLLLDALSSNSYAKILAEPNLVTLNGQPASFVAGGQFAVPTAVGIDGIGAATTSFQSFGTQIFFTPTLSDKDRIRLVVTPTVSSVNSDLEVRGIPGLDTRTVSTTVDLREGQWLAIAGLIQDNQAGGESRVPYLGDIPVVGNVFTNRSVSRAETELIILVSPELIHPLEAEEVPLLLPGMEITEPNNCDFFFGGYYEGDPRCQHRSTVWPLQQERILEAHHQAMAEAKQMVEYERCQDYYLHGPVGFSN